MQKCCPILQASSEKKELCLEGKCEWWIHHDGKSGCAVSKIVPELFNIRAWLSILTKSLDEKE